MPRWTLEERIEARRQGIAKLAAAETPKNKAGWTRRLQKAIRLEREARALAKGMRPGRWMDVALSNADRRRIARRIKYPFNLPHYLEGIRHGDD